MRSLLLALVAAALLGCGSSSPAPSNAPRSATSATATPEAPAGGSDEQIRQAMEERRQFGLRADEAWVRAVASNPNARSDLLGIPLLPAEAIEFQGRQARLDGVAALVQRYVADHPDEFAGLFIDQDHRLVVVQFTANVDAHETALRKLVPGDDEPLAVRLARHSIADLQAVVDRIVADRKWMRTIDAAFMGGGVDEAQNRIFLEISSANPAAPALIAAHYGLTQDELQVTSDGTGIQLKPRGTVRGRVVRADGSPPGDNTFDLSWTPDREGPGSGECGSEVGMGVPPDGRFVLPCAPGGWTISVQAEGANGWVDVGSGHVVVPPGLAVDLLIRLDR